MSENGSAELGCYCSERKNPKMKEYFSDIPEGYCGFCDICGKPGHMRAHPRSPTTGAWCDEHYSDLLSYRIFTLNDIIPFLTAILLLGIAIAVIVSAW